MNQDQIAMTVGQIAGMALRLSVAEAEAFARNAGLTPRNAHIARAVAEFRRRLEEPIGEGRPSVAAP